MSFCTHINKLREDKSLTKTQLASVLGITRQQFARYEKGVAQPTADVLIRAADYFGVTTDELLGRGASNCVVLPNELTDDDVDIIKNFVFMLKRKRRKAN